MVKLLRPLKTKFCILNRLIYNSFAMASITLHAHALTQLVLIFMYHAHKVCYQVTRMDFYIQRFLAPLELNIDLLSGYWCRNRGAFEALQIWTCLKFSLHLSMSKLQKNRKKHAQNYIMFISPRIKGHDTSLWSLPLTQKRAMANGTCQYTVKKFQLINEN